MPDLCPKNIVIFAGINELNSSFCAILSHCLSIYWNNYSITLPWIVVKYATSNGFVIFASLFKNGNSSEMHPALCIIKEVTYCKYT